MQTRTIIVALAAMLLAAGAAQAGIVIDTVTVGNPGNAGELSGGTAASGDPDPARICGAVAYTYNIGKYEVTAGQYTAFLTAVGGVDTYALYNTGMSHTSYGSGITRSGGGTVGSPYTYSVAADFGNRPVNFVSFWDACRFANWLHNDQATGEQGPGTTETGAYTLNGYNGGDGRAIQRSADARWAVTSEDEWYKAAYYKGGGTDAGYFDYPTGTDTAPGQDMADVSGNNANYYTAPYTYPIDSGRYTTVAGEFQNSASPYGTFDQGGNVWEYNEAIVYQDLYRGWRGGAFNTVDDHALHASHRSYLLPTNEEGSIGFRVVEVPDPASMALLALGSIGMLLRRRGLSR